MKRALSFILALTLAFALLPTFASAVDMEPTELKPTEFTVNFSKCDLEKHGVESLDKILDLYNESKKRYDVLGSLNYFYGENWTFYTTKASSNIYRRVDSSGKTPAQIVTYYETGSGNYFNFDTYAADIALGYHTVGFDIEVPAAGYYDITAKVYAGVNGGNAEVFIAGSSVGIVDMYCNKNGGEMNGYAAAGPNTVEYGKNVYLNAGTNRLKIKNTVHGTNNRVVNGFYGFTFTPSANRVNPNVTFAATTNVPGDTISVETVARGASVDLASYMTRAGYEFVGWKRGANDADSAWIDIDGDSYNVWTNTFLTAIYKPTGENAAKTVDFWNQNGAYMGTAADEASYKTMVVQQPTLTGFGAFQGWFTDGKVQLDENTVLSAGTTNAVAQYEDSVVSGVTLNGEDVTEADTYNEPISLTESGVTYWKRGGKTIAYGDTYNFNVWAGSKITSHTDEVDDKTPVAILEKNTDYNAYMFEYDDGDYTIVEAGIIFGGTDATVDSCTNKYTSQRKVSHNQFTVPAETGTAKGYIIWKDNSNAYHIDYFTE